MKKLHFLHEIQNNLMEMINFICTTRFCQLQGATPAEKESKIVEFGKLTNYGNKPNIKASPSDLRLVFVTPR
jgi:hypothetical protein